MIHQQKGNGVANGKIILLGEHSVVYGKPSIALPFQAVTTQTLVTTSQEKTEIHCDFYHGLIDDLPELLDSLREVVRVCLVTLNQESTPINITIDSQIPAERGMGSSAAVAVATTRAIFDFFKSPLTDELLLEIVGISEKIAHGNPSGLDALMTSGHRSVCFIKNQPPRDIELNLSAFLVVADTGITGQTKEAVSSLSKKLETCETGYFQDIIDKLGHLTYDGLSYLQHNQPEKLGQVMNQTHNLLKELDISSPELDILVNSALDHNALGAKLTGGGRGGCMIALAKNKDDAKNIAQELKHAGAKQTWLYEMSE